MRMPMILSLLLAVSGLRAQSDELIIRGVTGNLHLEHTVAAKENWYSVGRLYNVDPKQLARYNHLTFTHPLSIGEELKIPLTAENFSQDGKKPATETLVPLYHIVQEKEWLYRISVNHNKVPIPALEKWNHVTGDEVHAGLHLIVGYLKVKTASSALARQGGPRVAKAVMPVQAPAESKADSERKAEAVKDGEKDHAGLAADQHESENAAVTQDAGMRRPDSGTALYRPKSRQAAAPAQSPDPGATPGPAPHFGGGKFKEDFSDGGHTESGQAGVFKSSSGWQDGKYYALINNIPVGTIVKITDQSNGKSVYAKVLGQLPEMKESIGLTVRLSNAAAAELGEGEGRFGIGVRY